MKREAWGPINIGPLGLKTGKGRLKSLRRWFNLTFPSLYVHGLPLCLNRPFRINGTSCTPPFKWQESYQTRTFLDPPLDSKSKVFFLDFTTGLLSLSVYEKVGLNCKAPWSVNPRKGPFKDVRISFKRTFPGIWCFGRPRNALVRKGRFKHARRRPGA